MTASRQIYDITVPLRSGMPVYEGDPEVQITRTGSLEDGDLANVSRLDFGAHTGTHIDAPVHFLDGAPGVDALSLDTLIGAAHVVDATHLHMHIGAGEIASLGLDEGVERVLFKTKNSQLWEQDTFSSNFIGLTVSAARVLVERGVRLVGIDYLSIAPKDDPAPTHRVLLEAGIVIVEGLDLRLVDPGMYELICLPLRIVGGDGAPARAVLRRLP
ncbi:MAG: cyclase family protein [Dehalococcoidia bacterium]